MPANTSPALVERFAINQGADPTIDFLNHRIANLKNSANTTVSGTAKTVEIDISGTPYCFLVYPTSSA